MERVLLFGVLVLFSVSHVHADDDDLSMSWPSWGDDSGEVGIQYPYFNPGAGQTGMTGWGTGFNQGYYDYPAYSNPYYPTYPNQYSSEQSPNYWYRDYPAAPAYPKRTYPYVPSYPQAPRYPQTHTSGESGSSSEEHGRQGVYPRQHVFNSGESSEEFVPGQQYPSSPIRGHHSSPPIRHQYPSPIRGHHSSSPIRGHSPLYRQHSSSPVRRQYPSSSVRHQYPSSPVRGQHSSSTFRGQYPSPPNRRHSSPSLLSLLGHLFDK